MAKHPAMIEYSYELKENLARRTIALFIDLCVVGVPLFILFVFLGLGLLQANPMNALFGLLGPIFYRQQVQGVQEASPFLSMIVFVILQSFLLPLYYTFWESNSKRTLGKYMMHLDPIRSDNMFPTRWDALQRNYLKYFAGAIGGYLLGFFGWFLFIGVACLIDLKLAPEYKLDMRQRATEIPFSTAVLVERPRARFGEIAIDQGKWAKLKEKEKKAKKFASRMKKESKTRNKMDKLHSIEDQKREKIKLALEKTKNDTKKILDDVKEKPELAAGVSEKVKIKKEKPLLKKPEPEESVEEVDDLDIDLDETEDVKVKVKKTEAAPLLVSKPERRPKKQEETSLEEDEREEKEGQEEDKGEKVPFWKKLFGFGKKKSEEEEGPKRETAETSEKLSAGLPPVKKDSVKDEIILNFMMDFDIDEERAKGLFDMGYRRKEDLKDAIPQDLMMIKGLNPTIAKRILKRANE